MIPRVAGEVRMSGNRETRPREVRIPCKGRMGDIKMWKKGRRRRSRRRTFDSNVRRLATVPFRLSEPSSSAHVDVSQCVCSKHVWGFEWLQRFA